MSSFLKQSDRGINRKNKIILASVNFLCQSNVSPIDPVLPQTHHVPLLVLSATVKGQV